jgi:hypothetical protein
MSRYVCGLLVLSLTLPGCALWDTGEDIFRSTLRRPNPVDIDTAGEDTLPTGVNSWGGSEFAAARDSAPADNVDPLLSKTGQDIQRRLGDEE